MTIGATLSQGQLGCFSARGFQDNQALQVYKVKHYETNKRTSLSSPPSCSIYPMRKIALRGDTCLRNNFQGKSEHSSPSGAFIYSLCITSKHLKSGRRFSGKFKCFLSSESSNGYWEKPRNLAKLGISLDRKWQDYDLRFKAFADTEPEFGTDGPDSVPSFKVLPESVGVEKKVDHKTQLWKEFPKRWVIVLLCFFAFLLCNMDRVNMSIAILPMSSEFKWSPSTVGLVQSSFFWGYLLTQIAGGILADKIGGKLVLGFGVMWWSIATVLTPIAAKVGLPLLLFVRALMGIGEGVAMPAMNNMLSKWIPVKERSRSLALVYSGMYLGSVTGLGFSPILIQKFGWASVFYSFGSIGAIWFALWRRNAHSSPLEDPELSTEEKELIVGKSEPKEPVKSIPWKLLLSKAPVWALIISHFCHNWGTFRFGGDPKAQWAENLFLEFLNTFSMDMGASAASGEVSGRQKLYEAELESMRARESTTLYVDFSHIMQFDDTLQQAISDEFLRFEPYLRNACKRFVIQHRPTYITDDDPNKDVNLAFYNIPTLRRLRDMTTAEIGKLVAVSGVVTRTSEVRPELLQGTFKCLDCGGVIKNVEQQFKYTQPVICVNATCANRDRWALLRQESKFADWQRVRMQETSKEIPAGSLPRSLDVILRHEIVEQARAGDKVIFTGTVVVIPDVSALASPGDRAESRREGPQNRSASSGYEGVRGLKALGVRDLSYRLAFIANSVQLHDKKRGFDFRGAKKDGEDDDTPHFTMEERNEIQQMRSTMDFFNKLVESLAPTVFGHQEIKRALLLMLVGGVHKQTHEGINLRGDINVCIVGDPSCAKSQFLKYAASIVPRAVYTSGKSSSAAGLTATVVKEPETGEFCIEAGALMLADNGICCIDEFDKMDVKDQVAIHEAMEQQTISITKAGIQATLNARTSILAAANPTGGRYDKSKPLKYNVALPPPILSRFDLIYVMIDEPDDQIDHHIADHIVRVHQKHEEALSPSFTTAQIQRYVAYAKTVKPNLGPEARKVLVDSYVSLRRDDAAPGSRAAYRITVRQLEALIRLSEAIARVHLESEVRPAHVHMATRLINTSIISVDSNEIDLADFQDDNINEQQPGSATQEDQPETRGNQASGAAAPAAEAGDQPKQKMTVTYEHFQKVTRALVMRLRQHEESVKDDGGLAGLKQKDLVKWYIEDLNSERVFDTINALYEEVKCVKSIIQHLINREGVLLVLDDGPEAAPTTGAEASAQSKRNDERILAVNPNYVLE